MGQETQASVHPEKIADALGVTQQLLADWSEREVHDGVVRELWGRSAYLGCLRRDIEEAVRAMAPDAPLTGWLRHAQGVAAQYQEAMEHLASRYRVAHPQGMDATPLPASLSWVFAPDRGGDDTTIPLVGPSLRAAGAQMMGRVYAQWPEAVRTAFEAPFSDWFDRQAYWALGETPLGALSSSKGRQALLTRTIHRCGEWGDLKLAMELESVAARLDPERPPSRGEVETREQRGGHPAREDTREPVTLENYRQAGAVVRQVELSTAVAALLGSSPSRPAGVVGGEPRGGGGPQLPSLDGLLERIREWVRQGHRRDDDAYEHYREAMKEYGLRALAILMPTSLLAEQKDAVVDRANSGWKNRFASHNQRQAHAERVAARQRLGAPVEPSGRLDESPLPGLPPRLVPSLREIATQTYPDAAALLAAVGQAWGPTFASRISDMQGTATDEDTLGSYRAHTGELSLAQDTRDALGRFAHGDRTLDSVKAFSTLQHEILHAFSPARLDARRQDLSTRRGRRASNERKSIEEGLVEWGAATLTSRAVLGVEDAWHTDLSVSYVASVAGIERILDTHGEAAVGAIWNEPTFEGRTAVREALRGGPSTGLRRARAAGPRLVGRMLTFVRSGGIQQPRLAAMLPQMEFESVRDALVIPPAPIWQVAAPETPSRSGLRR